jgi:hypothetical protein
MLLPQESSIEHFGMCVGARDETDADCSANGLCHFPLIDGSEAGLADVLDATH